MPAAVEGAGAGRRALALLYTPAPGQSCLQALLGIEAQLRSSLRAEHEVAHARLSWWRDECARTARGEPLHPLTQHLTAVFATRGLPPPPSLAGLVDVAVWDLASATFERQAELSAYCTRWSGGLLQPLALFSAAADGNPVHDPLTALGATLCELELLLALRGHAAQGRLRLPLDALAAAGLPAQDAARVLGQDTWPAALASLLNERHCDLRQRLAAALAALPRQTGLRGVAVWGALALSHSRAAARRLPEATASRHPRAPLDALRAWSAARSWQKGRQQKMTSTLRSSRV
ncbi:MAG: squalene/phytoene synthase family protein [Proteobacteria bacterium]|nr:squalene/phytoene synthase family protein [Pseudomonadota bacterium]